MLGHDWRSPPNKGFRLSVGGGPWGVAHACDHLEIFTAVASLIRAQRYEVAMTILENEIEAMNSNVDR